MKFSAGIVLPLALLAIAPVAASAQQADATYFASEHVVAAPRLAMAIMQDPPSEKPEDVMGRSGIFLGIVGMLGGAAIGSGISQGHCESTDEGCTSRWAFTGALVASTIMVPLGVHIANEKPKSLLKSIAVSAVAGTVLYYGFKAIPGEPIQIAPFLAAPLQMVTSLRIER